MALKCVSFHADEDDWIELQKYSLDCKDGCSASSITRQLIKEKLKDVRQLPKSR